jgi:hypothetical protein
MKFKMLPFFTLTAATFLMLPVVRAAGPYSSKFQNAPATDSTAVAEAESVPAKKTVRSHKAHDGQKHGWGKKHHRMKHFMKNLSEDERARVKSIHQKLRGNPEVAAARDAMKNAEGREAKRAAFKKLREVRRAAMSDEDRAFMDQLKEKAKSNKSHKKCSKE